VIKKNFPILKRGVSMNKRRFGWMTVVVVAALLSAAAPTLAREQAGGEELAVLAEQGEHIFQQKCVACHTVGGGDRPTGPDLAGVTDRRDRQWLIRMIRHPGELLDSGDPAAAEMLEKFKGLRMPDLDISDDEAEALIAYLKIPGEEEHAVAERVAPPAPTVAEGDKERGRALYSGALPMENGGAPCLACHGIAGFGAAGGANFGVDLTDIYENYGPEGVVSILETLPFPSMEPIYAARPLTASEQADLMAFFAEVTGNEPVQINKVLLLQTGAGVILLLILAAVIWRGRLGTVRRSLVEKATRERIR
jgi:mono/diheme cytochrome c family protein